jgi:hypothetical protein
MLKVLVACEHTQKVTKALRDLGHEAYSCDLLPGKINSNWHLQCDVREVLKIKWDMIIAFPPCTDLSSAGALYWKEKQADGRQQAAIEFVLNIYNNPCSFVCIENPRGILSTVWRKPDQIIQPFYFNDPYKKMTCLWLKGLPNLIPIGIVEPIASWSSGSYRTGKRADGTRRKLDLPTLHRNPNKRSESFDGISLAIASQFTEFVESQITSNQELALKK